MPFASAVLIMAIAVVAPAAWAVQGSLALTTGFVTVVRPTGPLHLLSVPRQWSGRPRLCQPIPGPAAPASASRSLLLTLITSKAVRKASPAIAAAGTKATEMPCASTS